MFCTTVMVELSEMQEDADAFVVWNDLSNLSDKWGTLYQRYSTWYWFYCTCIWSNSTSQPCGHFWILGLCDICTFVRPPTVPNRLYSIQEEHYIFRPGGRRRREGCMFGSTNKLYRINFCFQYCVLWVSLRPVSERVWWNIIYTATT